MIRALTILGLLALGVAVVLLAVDAERFAIVVIVLVLATGAIGGVLGIRRVGERRREGIGVELGGGARSSSAGPDASEGPGPGGGGPPQRTSAEEIGVAAASAGATAGIAIDAAAEGGYHEPPASADEPGPEASGDAPDNERGS